MKILGQHKENKNWVFFYVGNGWAWGNGSHTQLVCDLEDHEFDYTEWEEKKFGLNDSSDYNWTINLVVKSAAVKNRS